MLNSLLKKKNPAPEQMSNSTLALCPEFPALKRPFGNTSVLLSSLLFVTLCHSLGLLFALFSKCIRLKIKSQTTGTEMSQFRVGRVRFFSCDGAAECQRLSVTIHICCEPIYGCIDELSPPALSQRAEYTPKLTS